ncbi:MAG: tRNA-(ms[2]io[6]A)-hydroxylase [Luteibaculum sp.]
MLGLKMATDPRWVNIVEKNIAEILTDHAYCEQKAASNAISIIVKYPMYPDLVQEMSRIAQEEMEHFEQVHKKIIDRGLDFGFERKDPYVNDLLTFIPKGGDRRDQLTYRLLFAAMIEARSCERFKILSENIQDPDLKVFYRSLMESEANHYTTFLGFARKYGNDRVEELWKNYLQFEADLMAKYGKSETIHG